VLTFASAARHTWYETLARQPAASQPQKVDVIVDDGDVMQFAMVLCGFIAFLTLVGWLARLLVDHRRWLRATKTQTERCSSRYFRSAPRSAPPLFWPLFSSTWCSRTTDQPLATVVNRTPGPAVLVHDIAPRAGKALNLRWTSSSRPFSE